MKIKKFSLFLGSMLMLNWACNTATNPPNHSATTTTTPATTAVADEPIVESKIEQVHQNYQQQVAALCKNGDFFVKNIAESTELIQLEQQALGTAPADKRPNIEARIEKYKQNLDKQKSELQQMFKETIDQILETAPYSVASGNKQHPSIKKRVATDIQTHCEAVFVQLELGNFLQ